MPTQLGRLPIVTESTITESGWYWFEPQYPDSGGPTKGSLVYVNQDMIRWHCLECRRYSGKYAGPIESPDMSCQHCQGKLVRMETFYAVYHCENCGENYKVAD